MFALYGLGAQPVDLTTIDAYVRPGFSLEWVFQSPMLGDESWTIVPGNTGNRPLVMRNLDLPGSGTRSLFNFATELPQRYCVMLPFVVEEDILISRTGVGLFLAQIGQNWQIYLNGYLVRDETYTAGDGTMRVERAVRGALVELDTRYLKRGKNLLTIMVMGYPGNDRTGLYMGGPYLVDSYDALESMRKEGLKLILIGIYFFFGLYHAILFMLRPKAKAYLYYGLATGLLSIYLFCRTFIVYEIILDTRIIKGVELSSLFLLVPAFMAFLDSVRARPVSLFAKLYGGVFALVAVLRFFFWSEAFLRFWQYSIVLPILYIFIVDIGIPIVVAVKDYRGSGYTRFWRRLLGGLKSSDAAKLLVGTLVVGSAVVYDMVGLNAGRAALYSDYAYLLLVFGTAATLAGQIVRAYRDSESLGADLARRVEARTLELEATLEDQEELSVSLSETSTSLQTKVEAAAKDMRVATRVQQGFFPGTAPQTDAWDCAFSFIPASGISGDFYDFFMRGDRLDGLVVGDVSGHGIASGLITVLARSIFHRNFYELKRRTVTGAITGEIIGSIAQRALREILITTHTTYPAI